MSFKPLLFLILLLPLMINGQDQTISGYLNDETTGEALIGAAVYITPSHKGTTTNAYGFYSISLPSSDSLGIVFSYLGYEPQIKKIYLSKNLQLDVNLSPVAVSLEEVVISGRQKNNNENVKNPQMSVIDIPISKIKEMPVLLGESDVLKVIQSLPGVQAGNEGTTGFHVRGGNTDQNLVQLDEAIVYNPNHLFGLFSTFNSRTLNKVTLIKGGFPAQYGGRLSSILDIQMKEGNNKTFHTEGGIGLITSQLTVEGPLKKDKASFIVSGRRTYLDLIVRPFLPGGNESNYHFYDLNAKVNWKISSKDRLFISGFKGKDDAKYFESQGLQYNIEFGNSTATLRWNHLFGAKLFSNISAIFNNYEQNISTFQDNSFSNVFSGIRDFSGKVAFQYFPNTNHLIRFGANYTNHRFQSQGSSGSKGTGEPSEPISKNNTPTKYFNEFAFYLNDEWTISERFSANVGVRAPAFLAEEVSYFTIEPRVSLKFGINATSSVKAAYTMMNQFLHLIPSSTASVPTDIWIPSTNQTEPQFSQQFAIGYFKNFKENQYEANVELYYKTMDKQVLFKEGNQLIADLDVDSFLAYGKGWSYGAEFFLKKNTGKLTGWISYTLSKTDQQFEELNFGERFPFKYDRRHVLSIVANYEINKRWSISGGFTFSSGNAYTLPVGRINVNYGGSLFEGNYFIYEARNNVRLRAYHRLDISATYKKQRRLFKKTYDSELIFGFYNIYSRQNPYFIYFLVDAATEQPKAKQVSLLPVVPGISYNFRF